jgi:hypothetical protein
MMHSFPQLRAGERFLGCLVIPIGSAPGDASNEAFAFYLSSDFPPFLEDQNLV